MELPDGNRIHVAYAGHNGHRYTAIGKVLKEQGQLEDPITLPKIRRWLIDHPDHQERLFNHNARYIFFKTTSMPSLGTLGIALTPEHSLAVDRTLIPLGLPVFVNTTRTADGASFQRLMIAQDTGSAISGPNRGDIFFGSGEDAAHYAGAQQTPGAMFILAPR